MLKFGTQPKKEKVADVIERELEVLLRVARGITGNDAVAEDMVSQAISIAFQKWDAFDGRHARSWLIQIVRNEWLQHLRKSGTRREVAVDLVAEPSDEGFWKAVDEKIEAQNILSELDALGEDYRLAILLCDVEQLSYDEAAQSLSIPLGTLQSRLFRGRKMLRARLVAQGI
ncbi:RNA polymerase sigma factor [soil metagenome]